MKLRLNQIELVAAICKAVEKQGRQQSIKSVTTTTRQLNAVIAAANDIVAAFAQDDAPAKAGMGLVAWLASDDTGLSSRAMAHHLLGVPVEHVRENYHPLDPSDFGRCHRFLEAVPEARALLPKMAAVSNVWAQLVAAWDELTALYLQEFPTGTAPQLYARMKALGC